jgi:hypothetical protein
MPRSDSVNWRPGYMLTFHPIKAQERAINCLRADLSKRSNRFEGGIHLNDTGLVERVYDQGRSIPSQMNQLCRCPLSEFQRISLNHISTAIRLAAKKVWIIFAVEFLLRQSSCCPGMHTSQFVTISILFQMSVM